MKKRYEKPQVYMEKFELAEHIAGCKLTLQQGDVDVCEATGTIERLKNSRAFLKLYSGMIVNTWRPDFVERVVDLTKDLIEQIPVYLLKCTPDYEAVKMLKSVLERE